MLYIPHWHIPHPMTGSLYALCWAGRVSLCRQLVSTCRKLAQHFWIGRKQIPLCMLSRSVMSLCDPRDCSLPGSSVHGILRARILEWAAIPFSSSVSSVQSLNRVRLFATPRTADQQVSYSQSLLKLMSIESVCHPTISSSVVPFSSCRQTFPASGSFPMSPFFT